MMLPDGIYLNLPAQPYHDDPALGGHDLQRLLTNAVQWHARERNAAWRALHPLSEKESAAKIFGTLLHTVALEPEKFDERYFVRPDLPDDLPSTKREIRDAIADLGASWPPNSAKADVFEAEAERLGIITKGRWFRQMEAARGDRQLVSAEWARDVKLIRAMIEAHASAMKFLSNGRAEVSVFWTDEHGTRLKCRFDYLRVRPVSDVKTYAYREGEEAIQSFVSQSDKFGYDFAAAHYMDLRVRAIPPLVERGAVYDGARFDGDWLTIEYASDEDQRFMKRVADEPEPRWHWIACMTQGFPEVDTVNFPMGLLQFQSAMVQVEEARANYRKFVEIHGDTPDVPWISSRRLVTLTDYNFMSARARDRGSIKYEESDA